MITMLTATSAAMNARAMPEDGIYGSQSARVVLKGSERGTWTAPVTRALSPVAGPLWAAGVPKEVCRLHDSDRTLPEALRGDVQEALRSQMICHSWVDDSQADLACAVAPGLGVALLTKVDHCLLVAAPGPAPKQWVCFDVPRKEWLAIVRHGDPPLHVSELRAPVTTSGADAASAWISAIKDAKRCIYQKVPAPRTLRKLFKRQCM